MLAVLRHNHCRGDVGPSVSLEMGQNGKPGQVGLEYGLLESRGVHFLYLAVIFNSPQIFQQVFSLDAQCPGQ
jgi:hypothetical protein